MLWVDHYGLTIDGLEATALEQLDNQNAQNNSGTNHAIHVKRLEPEHLVNPIPGDDFGFGQRDPEYHTDDQVPEKFHCVHSYIDNKEGSTKYVTNNPPMKKPITAMRDGNCKSLNPLMACPEVHPPA